MNIDSARFGPLDVPEDDIIEFCSPLLGFEQHRRFALLDVADLLPLRWLQSVEDSQLCLPVIEPHLLVPDYEIDVPTRDAEELDLSSQQDAYLLCVVVLGHTEQDVRLNLRAPIVWNLRTRKAKQIVLDDPRYVVGFRVLQGRRGPPPSGRQPAQQEKEIVRAGT